MASDRTDKCSIGAISLGLKDYVFDLESYNIPVRSWPCIQQDSRIEDMWLNAIRESSKPLINKEEKIMRIVQIFIVDTTNEIKKVEDRLIETTDTFLTDLTDSDLKLNFDISGCLKKHNEKRSSIIKEDVALEAITVKDLSFTVVELARV